MGIASLRGFKRACAVLMYSEARRRRQRGGAVRPDALNTAAAGGHTEAIKILIKAGALSTGASPGTARRLPLPYTGLLD